jgi:heme/copper-type cytochrome/quinol oxidase subunit 3
MDPKPLKVPTRSMEATSAGEAASVARARRTIPNGVWGMLLLIATEGMLFGTLIASYFYLRFRSAQWPPAGIEDPSVALPLSLAGALLLTTAPMLLAARAMTRRRVGIAWALVALSTLVQGGYLAWQIVLYIDDLSKFSPGATSYGSIYFTLLGADHAHVLVGIVLNLWVLMRLLGGVTNYRLVTVQVVALYWVFVNLLTMLVTLTQVSPA